MLIIFSACNNLDALSSYYVIFEIRSNYNVAISGELDPNRGLKMISYLKNKCRHFLIKIVRFLIKIVHSILRDPSVIKAVHSILNEPSVKSALWKPSDRPLYQIGQTVYPAANPWMQLWSYAGWETAKFIEKNMITTPVYTDRKKLLEFALSRVKVDGLYLEFGVGNRAESINFIAEKIDRTINGFDSFEGLPEDWFGNLNKGVFTTDRQLPDVRENVKLHVGLFEQTLPDFVKTHNGQVAFMHIDCDLYASTKTVFDFFENKINTGTVIQFDEYFNYPGWKNHEFKAFQEFITKSGLRYEYLGYSTLFQVAVIIKK